MSTENQESKQYPVDAIHYYPKDKRLIIEVEGGLSFALNQTPEGLFAQLLLNQAASQRAAVLQDDAVPVADSFLKETSPQLVENPPPASAPIVANADSQPAAPEAATDDLAPEARRGKQRILKGRLKSTPRDGKTDSKGRPTAWAKFAAHDDETGGSMMLSTTFHNWTKDIALRLREEQQIVVQGYYRPNSIPNRLDGLSVFQFIEYPGKPTKGHDQS
jgi:hypothetical protein